MQSCFRQRTLDDDLAGSHRDGGRDGCADCPSRRRSGSSRRAPGLNLCTTCAVHGTVQPTSRSDLYTHIAPSGSHNRVQRLQSSKVLSEQTMATALEMAVEMAFWMFLMIWTADRARVKTAAVAVATEREMAVDCAAAEPWPVVSQQCYQLHACLRPLESGCSTGNLPMYRDSITTGEQADQSRKLDGCQTLLGFQTKYVRKVQDGNVCRGIRGVRSRQIEPTLHAGGCRRSCGGIGDGHVKRLARRRRHGQAVVDARAREGICNRVSGGCRDGIGSPSGLSATSPAGF